MNLKVQLANIDEDSIIRIKSNWNQRVSWGPYNNHTLSVKENLYKIVVATQSGGKK